MNIKRIIPCLDVANGRVVKGVNFVELRDAGDPVELAMRYAEQGADELTLLDITATTDGREAIFPVVQAVSQSIAIPLIMGGGIRSVADIERLFASGASKASIGSAAIATPELIREASQAFGRERIIVGIDGKRRTATEEARLGANGQPVGPGWDVMSHGGQKNTEMDVLAWARQMADYGAGEILLTSVDRDGKQNGFDLALTRAVSDAAGIPVIASGGVGSLEHLADGVEIGGADAVLAASIFHFGTYSIRQAKEFMAARGIPVRL